MASKPQLARALASDLTDLEQVESVVRHDGSTGSVDFHVSDTSGPLSGNRVSRLLPDGWQATIVVTANSYTSAYIEEGD